MPKIICDCGMSYLCCVKKTGDVLDCRKCGKKLLVQYDASPDSMPHLDASEESMADTNLEHPPATVFFLPGTAL